MNSKQIVVLLLATALLAAAISATISGFIIDDAGSQNSSQTQILDRLELLETKLAREYEARKTLENLLSTRGSLAESTDRFEEFASFDNPGQELEGKALSLDSIQELETPETTSTDSIQSRAALKKMALVKTGLSEDEATYILRSESDVTLQQLNSRYQNQREAYEQSESQNQLNLSQTNPLRAKLGDDYYENYLQANGFPTSARVSSVIESSPAYNAGLQTGDRITSYAGNRVFNLNDVASLTLQGNPGESVLLEIERDGEALQLTIPRGPIGVSSGRNRFGR